MLFEAVHEEAVILQCNPNCFMIQCSTSFQFFTVNHAHFEMFAIIINGNTVKAK